MSNRLTKGKALFGSVATDAGITIGVMGTTAADAATKSYVDATAQGLNVKNSVAATATTNITLSAPQTIDGVVLVAGNRVLVSGQSTASQNGLWVVAAGAWTRPSDFAAGSVQLPGDFVFVEGGTVNGSSGWVMQGTTSVTVDTTANNWTQFSGAAEITVGAGLVKSGNVISLSAAPRTITASTDTTGASDTNLIANFAGTVTLTLPSASANTGRALTVKTITANTVVSASANVAPLIGGAAGTAILAATAGKFAELFSDGTNWVIMAGN